MHAHVCYQGGGWRGPGGVMAIGVDGLEGGWGGDGLGVRGERLMGWRGPGG